MPPPSSLVLLPLSVLLVMVRVLLLRMPPPPELALLLLIVLLLIVSVPPLKMPPLPKKETSLPPVIVTWLRSTLAPNPM